MIVFFIVIYVVLITATFSYFELNLATEGIMKSFKNNRDDYEGFVDYLLAYTKTGPVPKYKFFGKIIEELMKYQKRYGIDITKPSREIRKAAQRNKKEEKRIWEEFFGLIFQYFIIASFTWFFINHVQSALEVRFSIGNLLILGGWQVFGILFGIIVFYTFKEKRFKIFHSYFYTAYVFRSLIQISRPVSETIKVSRLNLLQGRKSLARIRDRFFYLVKGLKTQGHLPLEEFDNIIQELWDSYEDQFLKFHKLIMALKLFLILIFVLPGFLFSIYLSMEKLVF